MAKVRVRPETGTLFLDFMYRGKRCREQTALDDCVENRRKVQAMLNRIVKEIAQGSFDYAATFPGSAKIALFQAVATPAATPQPSAPPVPAAPTPLFNAFALTWREEMAPQWRRQHRIGVEEIFEKHLVPAFGTRPVGEITKADILAFRAELSTKPGRGKKVLSPARINKVMGLLRQAMTEATDRFSLSDSFKGVKRLKTRKPDVHPFSLDEVDRIRAAVRADFRNYLTTRFFTGMRTGEINGLKWRYVDFDSGLILVREVFSGGEVEENAKTESSLRDIPMLPMVREALQAQFANRNPDSEFVFCSRNGHPIDAHNFANRVWYPLLRYLEIEKRRPYQTRHTTATLMLASGENPEWIARLMGHVNTQMLFTVYSRFVPNLTRQDGRAITGLLNSRNAPAAPLPPAPAPTDLATLSRDQLEALVRTLAAGNDKEKPHAA